MSVILQIYYLITNHIRKLASIVTNDDKFVNLCFIKIFYLLICTQVFYAAVSYTNQTMACHILYKMSVNDDKHHRYTTNTLTGESVQ